MEIVTWFMISLAAPFIIKGSNGEEECGKVPTPSGRIFGGNKTCNGCIPWQVALMGQRKDGGKWMMKNETGGTWREFCGGTIINPKFVMTAAHCNNPPGPTKPEQIMVYAGVNDYNDAQAMKHDVKKIHQHPGFNFSFMDQTIFNDYSILELTKPINISEGSKAKAVCLPTKEDAAKFQDGKTKFVASGWGYGNDPENILRNIEIPFVSSEKCKESFIKRTEEDDYKKILLPKLNISVDQIPKIIDLIIQPTVICAGSIMPTASTPWNDSRVCWGDSGGPLTWQDPQTSKFKLIGATSFSLKGINETCEKYNITREWQECDNGTCSCCLPGYADAFSKITEVLPWINKVLKGEGKPVTTTPGSAEKSTESKASEGIFSPTPMGILATLYLVMSGAKKVFLV